jgi:hypothetical protein
VLLSSRSKKKKKMRSLTKWQADELFSRAKKIVVDTSHGEQKFFLPEIVLLQRCGCNLWGPVFYALKMCDDFELNFDHASVIYYKAN